MAIARRQLVDLPVTRWYHCVTRCVRRAILLGGGPPDRKKWIEQRLQELAEFFAAAVGGFSVLESPAPAGAPRPGCRGRRVG